jgi:hypothetical protein
MFHLIFTLILLVLASETVFSQQQKTKAFAGNFYSETSLCQLLKAR